MENVVESSKLSKFQIGGWVLFFFFFLFVFTLFRFPMGKVEGYVEAEIIKNLNRQGIQLSTRQSHISLFPRLTLHFEKIRVEIPDFPNPIELDDLKVTASYWSLALSRLSGDVIAKVGTSQIEIQNYSVPTQGLLNFAPGPGPIEITADLKNVSLSGIHLFETVGLKGSGQLTGKVDLSIDPSDFSKMTLDFKVNAKNVQIPKQPLSDFPNPFVRAFTLPAINLSELNTEIRARQGKMHFVTFQVGKDNQLEDDIHADVKGSITLQKVFHSSTADLNITFKFSDAINREFPFIKAILTPARQKNGSYKYSLTGPLNDMVPQPVAP